MNSRTCKLWRSPSERHVSAVEAAGSSEVSDKGREFKWLLLPTPHTAAFPEGGRPQQEKLNQWGSCFWVAAIYSVICKNEDQRVSVKMLSCKRRHSGKRCMTCSHALAAREFGKSGAWGCSSIPASIHRSRGAGTLSGGFFWRLWVLYGKLPIPQEIPCERDSEVPLLTLPLLLFQQIAPSSAQRDWETQARLFTSISFLSSLEPFLLPHPWMTFWTVPLFLWIMDSTYFCTVHKNLFWTQHSCHEEGMLHPDCPSLNLFSPLVRCVVMPAWSAAPGGKPLETSVIQALVVLLEISCDGLTAFTVHSVLLILQ